MAANTFALMDAVNISNAFVNPHKPDIDYITSENQYAYPISGILQSIVFELHNLGIDDSVIISAVDPLPLDEAGEFSSWTTDSKQGNSQSIFRYMTYDGYAGGLVNSTGTENVADDMSLDNLYLLANNMVWCWHNLYSFVAWTDFLSGEHQYNDKQTAGKPQNLNYLPAYHPWLANNFMHFSQVLTLTTNYDAANTTVNAHSIVYTSVNSTSISLISNNSPFKSNGSVWMTDTDGPHINNIAMWMYTANGTAEDTQRPGGLEIDCLTPGVSSTHPAASMTPKEVYLHFLNRVNNYTYMIRSFMTDSPEAGDYEPLPGVTRANTFIIEAKDWVEQRARAIHLADIMSRTPMPGPVSVKVEEAAAGLPHNPMNEPYIWAWNAVGETHEDDGVSIAGSSLESGTAAVKAGPAAAAMESVSSGIKMPLRSGTGEAWWEFYDDRATKASGILNAEDASKGNYMHVIFDPTEAPDVAVRNRAILYWVQDWGQNIYVGAYSDRRFDPQFYFNLPDGKEVIVFDMSRRDLVSDPPGGSVAEWGDLDNQPINPMILEPSWNNLTNTSGSDSLIWCGLILANRILIPDEITIPVDITKAWDYAG